MLDIHEVQIFLAAAEAGSFSEAGRRLQMSQPAVSQQIRALERRLDVRLFDRSGRHIHLTEVGQAFIPLAREMINLSIRAEETIASMKGEVIGLLRIACSTTAGKYVLPKLIAGFIEKYPGVQVACSVVSREAALEKMIDGTAQLAITSLCEPSRSLEYRPFIVDPVVLIVPPDHPWAARGRIGIDDLYNGRFIIRETNSGTHQSVTQALAEHNISVNSLNTVMILGSSEAIHIAVAEGIGVAFVSLRAAAEGIRHHRVVKVRIDELEIVQQLYMVRHLERAATNAQHAFWAHVFSPESRAVLAQ